MTKSKKSAITIGSSVLLLSILVAWWFNSRSNKTIVIQKPPETEARFEPIKKLPQQPTPQSDSPPPTIHPELPKPLAGLQTAGQSRPELAHADLVADQRPRQSEPMSVSREVIDKSTGVKASVTADMSVTFSNASKAEVWVADLKQFVAPEDSENKIRHISFDNGGRLKVVIGKHSYYEIDPSTRKVKFLGSD